MRLEIAEVFIPGKNSDAVTSPDLNTPFGNMLCDRELWSVG